MESFNNVSKAFLLEFQTPDSLDHSASRKPCHGSVSGGIMTVRFTYRKNKIRIVGAGYWRKGKKIYERENKIHG